MNGKLYIGPMSEAPWQKARWENFAPKEIACKCGCNEICIDEGALDALQRMRDLLGAPIHIGSGHRCVEHNREVGGEPHSVHLQLAFDIGINGYARGTLLALAQDAGFTRFGLMLDGLHLDTHLVDIHHARMWTYGKASREAWHGLFPPDTIDIRGGK